MPGRCTRRFVWVQRFGKFASVASGELKKSQPSVIGLCYTKSAYCFSPFLVGVWSNLVAPVSLDDEGVFPLDSGHDAL
ncbi:hypothetical protein DPMN_040742 [Dreissena polymorpha]|uniref:Uncharacterized protein n=1 Tax=Dreissena polymorpha TaxID=45954 RepID=A0A9D4HVL0_DREPO|nr:hypothetical protein DPMN_040742 [Dreissena polymorpha]